MRRKRGAEGTARYDTIRYDTGRDGDDGVARQCRRVANVSYLSRNRCRRLSFRVLHSPPRFYARGKSIYLVNRYITKILRRSLSAVHRSCRAHTLRRDVRVRRRHLQSSSLPFPSLSFPSLPFSSAVSRCSRSPRRTTALRRFFDLRFVAALRFSSSFLSLSRATAIMTAVARVRTSPLHHTRK